MPSSWSSLRPIKSGRNRQRILLFDVPESAVDSFGQPSQTPVQIVSSASDGGFWAEIVPLRGDEQLNARQVWPLATHHAYLRWLGNAIPTSADNPNGLIVPNMKIQCLLDGSILNVEFAENVERRNRQWKLVCSEHIGALT
jgi:hypothetical protein